KRKNYIKKIPFLMDIKDEKHSMFGSFKSNIFPRELVMQLQTRREQHLNYIQEFREKDSSNEWFELWPSSMNRNIPNIHTNRRLFKSYEPFTCNEIVKISVSVRQDWKLNRKLFHKAVRPYL